MNFYKKSSIHFWRNISRSRLCSIEREKSIAKSDNLNQKNKIEKSTIIYSNIRENNKNDNQQQISSLIHNIVE